MDQTELGNGASPWANQCPASAREVRGETVVAKCCSGSHPLAIPYALIHDWVAGLAISGVSIVQTLRLLQDYDNHKNIYKPEVIDSKLLRREGDQFHIYLRLLKKKIITVVLDTEHEVHYYAVGCDRWCCRSHTTRIAEVEHSGTAKEKVLPPDTGYGFLWRLNSYWRFQELGNAVWVECRAISLTRDVPKGMGWIIDPITRKLPRESLIHTLINTRRALI